MLVSTVLLFLIYWIAYTLFPIVVTQPYILTIAQDGFLYILPNTLNTQLPTHLIELSLMVRSLTYEKLTEVLLFVSWTNLRFTSLLCYFLLYL